MKLPGLQTARRAPLYIFLHIPKCAGTTFRHHVEHNLKEGEFVFFYVGDYFDVREMKRKYFTCTKRRKEIDSYLSCLTCEQKARVKILYGHHVYYGIHRFFPDREPRYVTFIRHPLGRMLSLYNSHRDHVENPFRYISEQENVCRTKELQNVHKDIVQRGRVLSFSEWLKRRTWQWNFMAKFLKQQGFAGPNDSAEEILRKFYLVGVTERFQTSALFLYHLLGITKFYPDQNASPAYIRPDSLSKNMRDSIVRKNASDTKLYEQALYSNRIFKTKTPYPYIVVLYMKFRMRFSSPQTATPHFETPAQLIYNVSFSMRQHFPLYSRSLDYLKKNFLFEASNWLKWKE